MNNRLVCSCMLLLAAGAAHAGGDASSYELGGGVAYVPRYAGSKDYHAAPQLIGSARFSNGFFIDLSDGVGYQATLGEHWSLTGSVGVDPGRTQRNDSFRPGSRSLQGMGDIKATATGGLGVVYAFDRGDVSLSASHALGGHDYGSAAHVQARFTVWQPGNDSVDVTAAAHYGNREYNQTYFGVTERQSERSSFAPFKGRGGVYAATAGASWTHPMGDHWISRVAVGITRYANAVKDSPIVQKDNAYNVGYYLTYHF